MSIYDYEVKDIKGNLVSLEKYKNKVLLIVNTATGCGFTPQYSGLESIYKEYNDRGLEILDFPCNQFANQAPGTDEEIQTFCKAKYDVSFDQFSKIDVNGKNESPLYKYLKENSKGILSTKIKWNFTKFLINKDGEVVGRYAPTIKPEVLKKDIEKLL